MLKCESWYLEAKYHTIWYHMEAVRARGTMMVLNVTCLFGTIWYSAFIWYHEWAHGTRWYQIVLSIIWYHIVLTWTFVVPSRGCGCHS